MSERLTHSDVFGGILTNSEINHFGGAHTGTEVAYCGEPIDKLFEIENMCYDASGNEITSLQRLRELVKADAEGRVVVLPCKVGDTVFVDKRTTPYQYFHPHDRVGAFAKCTVIGASITKSGIKIKMRANYPSRCGQYGFLKMGAGAFGKTVFMTQTEAERALAATEPKGDEARCD